MAVNVKAEWRGTSHSLCSGEWELYVNDIDVSNKIPNQLRKSPMGTLNEYRRWRFGGKSGWDVMWESYTDGLGEGDWIAANDSWLSKITSDYAVKAAIFAAIRKEDWRHGSCGGCI